MGVGTNWPQFGFIPSHSRYNPFENVLGPLNVAGLGLAWSYTTGDQEDSSPAVVGGVVYIGSGNGNEYALDASTGHKLWFYPVGGTDSSPAVAGGVVTSIGRLRS